MNKTRALMMQPIIMSSDHAKQIIYIKQFHGGSMKLNEMTKQKL